MYKQAILDLGALLQLLNKGTPQDISKLPGVGKKTLQRILDLRTQKANKATLKDVFGLPGVLGVGKLKKITGGNEEVAKVVQYCQYYHDNLGGTKNNLFSGVVAVDVGMSNIAMAHLSKTLEVVSWECLEFSPPKPYSPQNLYNEVSSLIDRLPLLNDSVFVIEGQSHRTLAGPAAGFNDIGLRLRLIEAMLYGVAKERKLNAFCMSPKIVSKYFETNRNGRYYQKKQAATLLSCQLVGAGGLERVPTPLGNFLCVPDKLVECYWKQKKMDDLSDCLLQAVSFIEWTDMSRIW